jgi:DNA-binding response OmpR family regulator
VVDDEPAARAFIAHELRQQGCDCKVAFGPAQWCQSHREAVFLPGKTAPGIQEVA